MSKKSKLRKGYVGWALDLVTRNHLLNLFPPAYEKIVAHHCTLKFGVDSSYPLPTETQAKIVGIADDHMGVQALVLKIGDEITRPDGSVYHITWSLGPGRNPVDSNKVIASQGFNSLPEPILINLIPQFFI